MSKHTPGPWIVAKGSTAYGKTWVGAPIEGDHGFCTEVAAVYEHHGSGDANARLIAAAPEMYEVLKATQSEICDRCPGYIDDDGELVGDHLDACVAATKAIAKAEGKS